METQDFINNWVDSLEGLEANEVKPETPLASLSQWDSLAVLTTIALCDADYGATLTSQDIQKVRTVGELAMLVSKKQA